MGERVSTILEGYLDFIKDTDAMVHPDIRTTIEEVECWITRDFVEPQRTDMIRKKGFKQPIEAFYYLRRNPILCGLMKFRFSLSLNEFGLMTSNQWGSTSKSHILITFEPRFA